MRDPFVVSSISWREVPLEMAIDNVVSIEGLLKANLQLSEYGDIAGVAFIYVIEQDENFYQDRFIYRPKLKEIHAQFRLPYLEVQKSTQQEVLHMMAAKYIETMELWLPKKKIVNFDWKRFVKDVHNVFEQQGWLEAVEV